MDSLPLISLLCSCGFPLSGAVTGASYQATLLFPAPALAFFASFSLRQSNEYSHLRSLSLKFHSSHRFAFRFIGPDEVHRPARTSVSGLILARFKRNKPRDRHALTLLLLVCSCQLIVQGAFIPVSKAIIRALNQANLPLPSQASLFAPQFWLRQSNKQSYLHSVFLFFLCTLCKHPSCKRSHPSFQSGKPAIPILSSVIALSSSLS